MNSKLSIRFAKVLILGLFIVSTYKLLQSALPISVGSYCSNLQCINTIQKEENLTDSGYLELMAPSRSAISIKKPSLSHITQTPDHLYSNPNDTGLVAPSGGITSLLKPLEPMVVPNVVHFVYFETGQPFAFHQMVSVLSADRIIKPDVIKLHCDKEPSGKYWDFIKENVSILVLKTIPSTVAVGTKRPNNPQNKSSVKRFQILQKEGGIYLDFDAIALKSFEPLRYYTMTMGIEYHGDPGRLNNGIILAAPGAMFLQKILDQYEKNYRFDEGDRHCCQIPYYLMFQYPRDIHVEEKTLNYPSGQQLYLIYDTVYDWSKNYAIHLWIRAKKWKTPSFKFDEDTVKSHNSTFGQILRFVYYGNSDIIRNSTNQYSQNKIYRYHRADSVASVS